MQFDRQGIDHVDPVDRADLGLAEGALQVEVAFEAVFRGLGVERFAVVELHAGPQLDCDGEAVGRSLVGEGELRHDGEPGIDIEQLVADRGEDHPRGVGARQGRIEDIGVVAQSDAEVALRKGGTRCREAKGGSQRDRANDPHRLSSRGSGLLDDVMVGPSAGLVLLPVSFREGLLAEVFLALTDEWKITN